MIKVNNVVKTFDGFRALDGLTMEVEKGSIYGLVGPNGAGKSTILRHITGIYRPDSGTITVDGAPVYENPAVKSRVAFIPDDLYYFLSASTRDMMKFYRGLYPAFDDKRYQVLKEAFPAVDEKQPIRRLSKGMQKQSAFWLALCCNPDLLVLDEPVDGLDPVNVTQVGRIHTLIVRGSSDVIKSRLAAFQPILMEALPLTLEEIFIYELGGEDYAVRDIML